MNATIVCTDMPDGTVNVKFSFSPSVMDEWSAAHRCAVEMVAVALRYSAPAADEPDEVPA